MDQEAQATQWGGGRPVSGFRAPPHILSSLPTGPPDSTRPGSQASARRLFSRVLPRHWAILPDGPGICSASPSRTGAPLGVEARLSWQGCPTAAWVPRAPSRLRFSARPPEDVVAPDCPAPPCPGLLPTSHLCQVSQGLLQPLSVLCLQGRLLLEPQGFLEWCGGDKGWSGSLP